MSEEIKKGGRIPKKNSEYYSKLSIRDSNTKLAKSIYGSLAVDCIQAAHERIGQADYFLFPLTDQNLQKLQLEDHITKEDFMKVIQYCSFDLGMFDRVLFENNFLFSIEFVRNFDRAGLFRHRTYGIKQILTAANHFRPGFPPLTAEDDLEIIARGGTLPMPMGSHPPLVPKSPGIVLVSVQEDIDSSTDQELDEDNLPF